MVLFFGTSTQSYFYTAANKRFAFIFSHKKSFRISSPLYDEYRNISEFWVSFRRKRNAFEFSILYHFIVDVKDNLSFKNILNCYSQINTVIVKYMKSQLR